MTDATVTLNGTQVTGHLGGYLPFSAEITGLLRPEGNVLAVRLDATFNLNVPPDRPAPEPAVSVDYWQPGGLYRDVQAAGRHRDEEPKDPPVAAPGGDHRVGEEVSRAAARASDSRSSRSSSAIRSTKG